MYELNGFPAGVCVGGQLNSLYVGKDRPWMCWSPLMGLLLERLIALFPANTPFYQILVFFFAEKG